MPRLPLLKHPILHFKNKWHHHKCKYGQPPEGNVIEEINGIKYTFDFTLGKMVRNMYFGSYEYEIVRMIKKRLRDGGVFIDVGANIGYITAIAAGLVGKAAGAVHSFEPVPTYFSYLQKTAELNPDYNIVVNNIALGEKAGQVQIANHQHNIGGNSIVPGYVAKADIAATFEVQIERLDDYISRKVLTDISLIKIDTEGYELPVLLGASAFFEQHKNNLPAIIAEVSPQAFELMGWDIRELADFMSGYGYKSYAICGRHRIDIMKIVDQTNVLFKV